MFRLQRKHPVKIITTQITGDPNSQINMIIEIDGLYVQEYLYMKSAGVDFLKSTRSPFGFNKELIDKYGKMKGFMSS